MKSQIVIDNSKPSDETYPSFKAAVLNDKLLFVDEGQYLVDYDGDVIIATTSNKRWADSGEFLRNINEPFIRAKYIGCRDDFLQCTNQIRVATQSEVKTAKKYEPVMGAKITSTGQVVLL